MITKADDTPSPFPLTDTDRNNLDSTDDQFHPLDWDELKQIIAKNDLDTLKRWPSDLRRYIKWSNDTKAEYGTVPNYVMKERLQWTPLPSSNPQDGPKFKFQSPIPFSDPRDYKIMPNDWPYGLAPGIKHLIVWLKPRLETEPRRGDLTSKARQQIEGFVQKTFTNKVQDLPGPEEKIMWFRNWTALQSVPGMEHIHILVRDVPDEVIAEWTRGEEPVQG